MTALRVWQKRASVSVDWLPRFCLTRVVTTPKCFYTQMFLHPNEILLHSMSHPTHLFLTWVTSLLPFNWNSPNPVVRRQSSRSYLSRHPDGRGRSSRCQECNLIAAVIKAPLGMSDSKVFRNKRLSRCKLKREILILTIGHTCYRFLRSELMSLLSICTSFPK